MREQLERHKRLSAMGEMAAGLAHQLRTPLATALLYAGNLARPGLSEPDRLRFAEKAQARLRDLERMIQDMLTFVRGVPAAHDLIELRRSAARARPGDGAADGEPRRALRLARAAAAAWRCAATARRWPARSSTCCENALQACGAGRRGAAGGAHRGRAWRGCAWPIAAQGMPPEVQERLFEPFFTTRTEGTGLGLAIVRSVIAAHGGEVRVESAPGRGAVFRVSLPLAEHAGEVGMKPLPVLIVEDDREPARSAHRHARALRLRGPRKPPKARPRSSCWKAARVGLVVSDVQMKPMDGEQLLREIKRRWPEMPVLLMTAYGMIERAVEAMRAGACNYLPKPFEPEVLVAEVARWMLPVAVQAPDDADRARRGFAAAAGAGAAASPDRRPRF